MLIHWIWLATRGSVNEYQKKQILDILSDPEAAYYAQDETIFALEGVSDEGKASLLDKDLTGAEKILRQCVDKDIQICVYADDMYPERLRHIPDPPLVLYYKGELPRMNDAPVIAAIGTRKASAYGLKMATEMGYQIARCGGIVVSGIADGIDAMAMRGAMLGGGKVIGVLGNGADVVYPKINRNLFEDTLRDGCLISEFPPETPPYRWNFPQRNRIISGLSDGAVVIEAPERSGALLTAKDALEQGRDVYVLPGNVDAPGFVGSNSLLRQGATPVRNGWDVVGEYAAKYPQSVHPAKDGDMPIFLPYWEEMPLKVAQNTVSPRKEGYSSKKKEKKPIDNNQAQPYSVLKTHNLNETEQAIVELLTSDRLVDDIIAESGLPAAKVSAALTMLEIKGVIARLPGNRVKLK